MLLLVLGSLAIVAQGGRTTYAVDESVKPAATGGDDKPSGLADFVPENNCYSTSVCLIVTPPCYKCIVGSETNEFRMKDDCQKTCPFPGVAATGRLVTYHSS
ncbi:hypothetical protein GUJ93_ZPchr0001g32670 [Zizania palustris]|uniref:Uncharacterized protein n=1 Tax=Zizania palustris TaxID=103762 RepID=A0A8J5RPH6_ZIZPA|nr:hypothetical protein GUJ93_ZPchr0001g32670 [Zizania palustris]